MNKLEMLFDQCTNKLPGHGSRRSMKEIFQSLADGLQGDEAMDRYGEGDYLNGFEKEIADMFGKEAAVFLPSGTMAQQIALRISCERRGDFTVAMHPTAHPEIAEHFGYQFLHDIKRIAFSAPEFLGSRILNVKDLEGLGKVPGAVLLELPYRPLGGELPGWDDLSAMSAWAREHGVPFHMDGARVWSCRPFYQKDFREIAGLFDSVYVSFYKDLGGMTGSMLMGPSDFIREARMWQRRYGGNLFSMAPYCVSARIGVQETLPKIDGWVKRAQAVAEVFSRFERVHIRPNPPQVNFFQIYIEGDAKALTERHHQLAEETGTFLFYGLGPTVVPGIGLTELHCWENAAKFDLEKLEPFLKKLLE
jgi:threonine aldolase